MRFINSLAILSLAGISLATPVTPRTGGLTSGPGDLAAALTGKSSESGLGLRDDKHKRYAGRGVRRRGGADEPVEEESTSGTSALRARGEGDEGESKSNPEGKGKGQGEDQSESKGKSSSGQKDLGQDFGLGKGKGKCNDVRHDTCLHPDDVETLVAAYVRILSNWNDDDAKYLADNFVDTSDSINILAGIPLGSPTFPTKEAFIEHQHTQPDNLPLVVTHKSPYSCDEIALVWQATFGAAQKQVRGLTIVGATKDKGYWQIKTIDVEFNSIAYLLDIGGSYTLPGQ